MPTKATVGRMLVPSASSGQATSSRDVPAKRHAARCRVQRRFTRLKPRRAGKAARGALHVWGARGIPNSLLRFRLLQFRFSKQPG